MFTESGRGLDLCLDVSGHLTGLRAEHP